MRSIESKRHRSREKRRSFFYPFLLLCFSASCVFSGCVRVAGGAGYWHTDPESGATVKKAGFDTADYVSGNSTPGKITT